MYDEAMRSWLKPLVAAGVLALSAAAHAQSSVERVTLADGTVMQGELVEKVPGDHITIKLATGEVRTIRWGALAPMPVAPPTPVMQQPTMQAPQTGPSVHVVVDGDRPEVTLVRIMGMGMVQAYTGYGTAYGAFEQSSPVCVAPCQADVDGNGMYRIAGAGVTPTGTFGLPASVPGQTVSLHVHAGSLGARVGGLWLIVGGVAFAVAGGTLAAVAAATSNSLTNEGGLLATGLVLGGIGVVALVIGIVLVAGSGTSVVTDQGFQVARHAPAKPRLTLSGLTF